MIKSPCRIHAACEGLSSAWDPWRGQVHYKTSCFYYISMDNTCISTTAFVNSDSFCVAVILFISAAKLFTDGCDCKEPPVGTIAFFVYCCTRQLSSPSIICVSEASGAASDREYVHNDLRVLTLGSLCTSCDVRLVVWTPLFHCFARLPSSMQLTMSHNSPCRC